jgi:hypothetical protein
MSEYVRAGCNTTLLSEFAAVRTIAEFARRPNSSSSARDSRFPGGTLARSRIVFARTEIRKDEGRHMQVQTNALAAISADDLAAVTQAKVFFGHQSVGMNVIDGIPGVYAARGLDAAKIVPCPAEAGAWTELSGYLAHAHIGQNGDPVAKIEDFDARTRGLGGDLDVALMKFCYADVTSDRDVDALFTRYRATMSALERDFPTVAFLHVTTPLTTERDLKSKFKALLGRNESGGPEDNANRERLNAMVRREYGADRLFDLAAIESTAPDGTRTSGSHQGHDYFALYPGYAADASHLNAEGSAIAAAQLLALIARASGSRRS